MTLKEAYEILEGKRILDSVEDVVIGYEVIEKGEDYYKRAHREIVKKYHPDVTTLKNKNLSSRIFSDAQNAYEFIKRFQENYKKGKFIHEDNYTICAKEYYATLPIGTFENKTKQNDTNEVKEEPIKRRPQQLGEEDKSRIVTAWDKSLYSEYFRNAANLKLQEKFDEFAKKCYILAGKLEKATSIEEIWACNIEFDEEGRSLIKYAENVHDYYLKAMKQLRSDRCTIKQLEDILRSFHVQNIDEIDQDPYTLNTWLESERDFILEEISNLINIKKSILRILRTELFQYVKGTEKEKNQFLLEVTNIIEDDSRSLADKLARVKYLYDQHQKLDLLSCKKTKTFKKLIETIEKDQRDMTEPEFIEQLAKFVSTNHFDKIEDTAQIPVISPKEIAKYIKLNRAIVKKDNKTISSELRTNNRVLKRTNARSLIELPKMNLEFDDAELIANNNMTLEALRKKSRASVIEWCYRYFMNNLTRRTVREIVYEYTDDYEKYKSHPNDMELLEKTYAKFLKKYQEFLQIDRREILTLNQFKKWIITEIRDTATCLVQYGIISSKEYDEKYGEFSSLEVRSKQELLDILADVSNKVGKIFIEYDPSTLKPITK